MLVLTRKVDDSIIIGGQIKVTVLEVSGNQVKLGINAPKDIPVFRSEIYESIVKENIRASSPPEDLEKLLDDIKI